MHLIDKISQICSELDSGYGDPIEVTKAYTGLVAGEEFEPWIPEKVDMILGAIRLVIYLLWLCLP